MNQIVQPIAFDVSHADVLGAATAADAAASRSVEVEAVEYGSGWYHDAEIAASEPASVQAH